jgi:RNA polymerase sigma factor (sigma-70 family)
MPEEVFDNFLKQISSRNPEEAWALFIDEYSPTILQVVRHLEGDSDFVPDCFQFVCERLIANSFRRLRKFQPGGPAVFATWLRAVVRNLCLDWRRKQFGRRRRFRSISRLPLFDQEVFASFYERGLSSEEGLPLLQARFPGATLAHVAESKERIEAQLTTRQQWLLSVHAGRRAPATNDAFEQVETTLDIPDHRPDPEALALLAERRAGLNSALAHLSKHERLLVRLRFEKDLTLEQIARLLDLGNAQRVDRQIKEILARLRDELS